MTAALALPAVADDRAAKPAEPARTAESSGLGQARDQLVKRRAEVQALQAELRRAEARLDQAERELLVQETLTRASLKRAEERLQWAERMHAKGYISTAQLVADRESVRTLKKQLGEAP